MGSKNTFRGPVVPDVYFCDLYIRNHALNRHLAAIYIHSLAVGFPLKEASIVLFVILYRTRKKNDDDIVVNVTKI